MATQTELRIVGMDCSHCAERLGQSLERLEGVIRATVDVAGTATVRFDEARLTAEQLDERVRDAGFDVA